MTCWLCGSKTTNLVTNAQTPCNAKNGPCQICIAVANLDEEINQAVAALQRLVAKRNDLRSHQNRAHDGLHRLPVELRTYIFQLLLPTEDKWGRIVRVGKSRISDLFSVCRNWHDLALSNPSFWCTIRIYLDTRTSTSDLSKFVHDWILRSRNLPLTLHIVVCAGAESWRRLLDVISASSNRWHSLSLEIPFEILRDSHRSNLQYDRLRRLRISTSPAQYPNQPVPSLFNPTMSPEEIDVTCLSFEALQISWNNVISATVLGVAVEDITQLFQHATRMTTCCIFDYLLDEAVPPIIHQNLKALRLHGIVDDKAAMLLGSLTLPCLRAFRANDLNLLTPAYLPALMHRSSCPLTSIRLSTRYVATFPLDLEPLPGVTNLVLERGDAELIRQLLLDGEYFPDLRYLTLRFLLFLLLWRNGTIRSLLDRNRPLPDAPNEGRLLKILVVDQYLAHEFDELWNSDVGEELKALNIVFREDGFEILLS